ncbi:MAG: beta-phosphoglucomutase family hydrolase, partial [Ramlibacter sp.]
MTCVLPAITLSPRDYDAVLFDLDGVLTRTASVHASAWKKLFDGFLEQRATRAGEPFVPFDIEADYPRYVDGKARLDGVAAFLESRGIKLPLGTPDDSPDGQSMHALGKSKDRYFLQHLEQHGVEPYEAAIALVRTLREQEVKTAVVSSSNNCAAVLDAAGIAQLFDTRVDGTDVTRLKLKGKPAPDAFLEAARRLGAQSARAVVVEDAIAGVEAGRAGRFGCVIGVDRRDQAQALHHAGADVVVTDLALLAELPEHLRDMAQFSVATGLRQGNVTRLQWQQISLERRHLWVSADQHKNGKAHAVPLNELAMAVLVRRQGGHA